jgi:site-specific recombinase XerC
MKWQKDVSGIPRGRYFRSLLLVAYWTGFRLSTLLKLRRADIDLETGWLNAPGNALKGKKGKRQRLGSDAIAAITEIWTPDRDLLSRGHSALAIFLSRFLGCSSPPD